MNHSDIAHRWAHKDYNRNGELNGTNVFAEAENHTIYSYGRHYCMGRHITEDMFDTTSPSAFSKRVREVIIEQYDVIIKNTINGSYSVSTSKHLGHVESATSHLHKLYLTDVPVTGFNKFYIRTTIRDYIKEIDLLIRKYDKARVKMLYLPDIDRYVNDIQHLKDFFSLTYKDLAEVVTKDFKRLIKWQGNITQEERDEMEEKWREHTQQPPVKPLEEQIQEFREGDRQTITNTDEPNRAYLRIHEKKDRVETSKAIQISFKEARLLWQLVQRHKNNPIIFKHGYAPKVQNVFSLNEIKQGGEVVIGCHTISYEEMERIQPEVFAEVEQEVAV